MVENPNRHADSGFLRGATSHVQIPFLASRQELHEAIFWVCGGDVSGDAQTSSWFFVLFFECR